MRRALIYLAMMYATSAMAFTNTERMVFYNPTTGAIFADELPAIDVLTAASPKLTLITTNAFTITISVTNTPTLIAGAWGVASSNKFTFVTNTLTYTGTNDVVLTALFVPFYEASLGSNQNTIFSINKNGSQVRESQPIPIDSGFPQQTVFLFPLALTMGDYIHFYVRNVTSTKNYDFSSITVSIY